MLYKRNMKYLYHFLCYVLLGSWIKGLQSAINGDSELIARILNGTPIKIVNYPFFASLGTCGGTIISDTWIVTAAHCVVIDALLVFFNPRPVCVGGGTNAECRRYYFDKVIIHPEFENLEDTKNDIALLRLTETLKFSPEVQPVELPRKPFTPGWMTLVSKGKDETGDVSKNVQMINLYGYNDKKCRNRENGEVFCAVRSKLKPGTCFGDSGSPMVRGRILVGIVSAIGEESCHINKYTFVVNVAFYTPWIKSVTGII